MMIVWILPIILFVFYGQRIQLYITSGEIKKGIKKLDIYKEESRNELIDYIQKNLKPKDDVIKKIDRFLDYFTIMPVDMDPNGIVDKVQHIVRSREDYTRERVKSLSPEISDLELTKVQTLLEIASSLQMIYKIVNHMYLTAKKQNNYPLILPLQMLLPFIMEQAEAMKEAIPAFKAGQPVGDGIGPMVVGKMMLDITKETVAFQTVLEKTEFENRKLFLLKAEVSSYSVRRPADPLEIIVSTNKLDVIIMIDAALKMQGDYSANWASGNEFVADMWHWKSSRSAPIGYAHDKMTIVSHKKLSKAYKLVNEKGLEIYIRRPSDSGDKLYKSMRYGLKEKALMQKYLPNDDVTGSVADVKARSKWRDGYWV